MCSISNRPSFYCFVTREVLCPLNQSTVDNSKYKEQWNTCKNWCIWLARCSLKALTTTGIPQGPQLYSSSIIESWLKPFLEYNCHGANAIYGDYYFKLKDPVGGLGFNFLQCSGLCYPLEPMDCSASMSVSKRFHMRSIWFMHHVEKPLSPRLRSAYAEYFTSVHLQKFKLRLISTGLCHENFCCGVNENMAQTMKTFPLKTKSISLIHVSKIRLRWQPLILWHDIDKIGLNLFLAWLVSFIGQTKNKSIMLPNFAKLRRPFWKATFSRKGASEGEKATKEELWKRLWCSSVNFLRKYHREDE